MCGLHTKYNGETNNDITATLNDAIIVPFCPEQLAGFSTPREKITLIGGDGFAILKGKGRVVNESGKDVTENILRAVLECKKLIKIIHPDYIILKEGSPSCGVNLTNINWQKEKGSGVICALLKQLNYPIKPVL